MKKPSVLLFTQNKWAFGQLHHALIKQLTLKGIYAHLLDCEQQYSNEEYYLLGKKFDIVLTTANSGLLASKGIDPNRIVYMAHAAEDIGRAISAHGAELFNSLRGFGVINPGIADVAFAHGLNRIPMIVRNGIDFDHFYAKIAPALKTVGYAGARYHMVSPTKDCKRVHLFDRVMANTGLYHNFHKNYNHLCMAGYYETIDGLLVTSDYEACGLPILEAAAAGRLVVSSAVGYFDGSHGALCRMPDDEFVIDAKNALLKYQDPVLYKEACEKAQQYARDHYDWSHVIDGWIDLLNLS